MMTPNDQQLGMKHWQPSVLLLAPRMPYDGQWETQESSNLFISIKRIEKGWSNGFGNGLGSSNLWNHETYI